MATSIGNVLSNYFSQLENIQKKKGIFGRGKVMVKSYKITNYTCSNCGLCDGYFSLINWRTGIEADFFRNNQDDYIILCTKCSWKIMNIYNMDLNIKRIWNTKLKNF